MARMFGQRPSTFLGLDGETWEAYEVDRSSMTFALWLDEQMAKRDRRGKPIYSLQMLLQDPDGDPGRQAYRSMRSLAKKRMKIPESGVW